jgi:UrcA family protein
MNMSTENPFHSLGLAVTLIIGAAASLPSLGAPGAEGPLSRVVSYYDLDITRPADAGALYRRIKAAADVVCSQLTVNPVRRTQVRNACLDQAIANSVAAVNEPARTSYYAAQHGTSSRPPVRAAGG